TCTFSLVMQTCSGTSSATSLSVCLSRTASMKGQRMSRPASSAVQYFPSRSTTHACCCGTTRTSFENTTMTKMTPTIVTSALAMTVSPMRDLDGADEQRQPVDTVDDAALPTRQWGGTDV